MYCSLQRESTDDMRLRLRLRITTSILNTQQIYLIIMANNLVGVAHVLLAIGFDVAAERTNIMAAGISEFEDFRYLVEKDIRDMADEFGKHSVANGKIVFGLGRTKN